MERAENFFRGLFLLRRNLLYRKTPCSRGEYLRIYKFQDLHRKRQNVTIFFSVWVESGWGRVKVWEGGRAHAPQVKKKSIFHKQPKASQANNKCNS